MPILALLGQCAAMFAASLLVGALPLMLKSTLSSASAPRNPLTLGKALSGIQVLGMGLLVGAALAIIIPE